MPRGKSDKPTFKPYDQTQQDLLPPTAAELIPENHLVRVVDATIERMDLSPLLRAYSIGGGASRYEPKMLLKVLVYAYMTGVYSSRRIAKELRENVHFMWLSGRQTPDFRTINRFRKHRLAPVIDEVFVSSVKLLAEAGYVSLKNFFLDGTKIEANANRYTFVWKRAIETNEKRLDEKLKEFLQTVKRIADEEDLEYGDNDLEEMGSGPISSELVERMAERLSGVLAKLEEKPPRKPENKKTLKKIAKTVSSDLLIRKQRYTTLRPIFRDRKSFSKTDPDATFMRLKEDHMRNGQLKPAYNVQVGTEQGFVVSYGLYSNPTDTRTLPDQIERFKRSFGGFPRRVVADAGYGSEQNYAYLRDAGIAGYIKYNFYQQEQKRRSKKYRYHTCRWPYDEASDELTCPQGHRLRYTHTTSYRSDAGYATTRRIYRCDACPFCPVQSECTTAQYRSTAFSPVLRAYQQNARRLIQSPPGSKLYRRRGPEVETVFGQIKANQGFTRFHLRGHTGASTEWGLLMMGYNFRRVARQL